MSKRLTAKEIKHDIREDEVRTFLARVFTVLQENPTVVGGSVAAVIFLAIAGSLTYAFVDSRRTTANERPRRSH